MSRFLAHYYLSLCLSGPGSQTEYYLGDANATWDSGEGSVLVAPLQRSRSVPGC